MNKSLWEILVPTVRNPDANGYKKPYTTRYHRVWDDRVRSITGGLTIQTPTKGEWVAPSGQEFTERMIPVRLFATEEQIEKIADMTAAYYNQLAVMFYVISRDVKIKHYSPAQ